MSFEICITHHAFAQYCKRVDEIEQDELKELCQSQFDQKQYGRFTKGFIQLAGVWWVYELHESSLVFVTCYGRTSMDVPKAIGWAVRNNDRINLAEMILAGETDAD